MKAIVVDFISKAKEYEKYDILFEQEIIELYDVFTKNGKYYACGATHKGYALLEEIQINNENDETFESDVTCPFCGNIRIDSWELSEIDDNCICGTCGALLSVERIITVEYATKLIKKPNIIEIVEVANDIR